MNHNSICWLLILSTTGYLTYLFVSAWKKDTKRHAEAMQRIYPLDPKPWSLPISITVDSILVGLKMVDIVPDRIDKTADDSILLQFIKGRDACIDIYPSGEIVVIVTEGEVDNVFSLGIEDKDLIVDLIKNGMNHFTTEGKSPLETPASE